MHTKVPYKQLQDNSWAKDFTMTADLKQRFMFIQCMGHYHATPDYTLLNRSNLHSYLFLYTVDGAGTVFYQGKAKKLPKGYGALINCEETHSYQCNPDTNWDLVWMHFSGNCVTGYMDMIFENWNVFRLNDGYSVFTELYESAQNNDMIHRLEVSSLIINLCSRIAMILLIDISTQNLNLSPIVQSAKDYFDEHFSESISLDEVCTLFHTSKYYFSHLFKKQIGASPVDYLISIRINYAKNLLRTTSLSVTEIAEKCGFSTSTYFIQIFHRNEGLTPLKYRQFSLSQENA